MPIRSQRELFGVRRALIDLRLADALEKLGEKYVEQMREILKERDKVATGKLINSLGWELLDTGDKLVLNLFADFYLEYVIKGRRPGAKPPPHQVLIPWMKARKIVPRNKKTGRFMSYKTLAFIMARSIGKKGIKPQPKIKQTLANIYNTQQQFIAEAAKDDIEDLVYRYLLMGTLQ